MNPNRRRLLGMTAAAAASTLLDPLLAQPAPALLQPQPVIPRWRGFNLTELLGGDRRQRYQESDFQWMAQWGFNFARLPCSYWTWSNKNNWMTIDETALQPLDRGNRLRPPVRDPLKPLSASYPRLLRQWP